MIIKLFNEDTILYLEIRLIKSDRVENVMKSVDRSDYVQDIQYAYENDSQLIGYGASISSPNAVSKKKPIRIVTTFINFILKWPEGAWLLIS